MTVRKLYHSRPNQTRFLITAPKARSLGGDKRRRDQSQSDFTRRRSRHSMLIHETRARTSLTTTCITATLTRRKRTELAKIRSENNLTRRKLRMLACLVNRASARTHASKPLWKKSSGLVLLRRGKKIANRHWRGGRANACLQFFCLSSTTPNRCNRLLC